MNCKAKHNPWSSVAAVLAGTLLLVATCAAEGFTFREGQVRQEADRLVVNARLDLQLSDASAEALDRGIPLEILFEFRLLKPRWWIVWDKLLKEWTLRARLEFHALSNLYLVTLPNDSEARAFPSRADALDYLGTLSHISLPAPAAGEDRFDLALRARIDVDALPAALRPMAYTLSGWRLKSKWKKWALER
ncbi:MAG: DUF4390 domain-containing protein [Gammaproteobacteria bacterium]|nr:DUF4390 domain-containing protein [Gammaproteobacteria bacterium]